MHKKKAMKSLLRYLFLIVTTAIIITPIIVVVLVSFKGRKEFYGNPIYALPQYFNFKNFHNALFSVKIAGYLKNSFLVTIIKVPLGVYLAALTAFGISRMDLKHQMGWFLFFLLGMMLPQQLLLIPLNIMLSRVSLLNTYLGLFIVYIGCGLSFGILVMRGYFRGIPKELDQAAKIDGCGWSATFHYIILPNSMPALTTLLIMNSVSTWNEYLLSSIIITKDSMRTITTGLMRCIDEVSTDYGVLSAAVLLSLIPLLVVYLIFQRYFVEGMAGAVKG